MDHVDIKMFEDKKNNHFGGSIVTIIVRELVTKIHRLKIIRKSLQGSFVFIKTQLAVNKRRGKK